MSIEKEKMFTYFDLTEFPQIDRKERKEEIIEAQKRVNKILKDSRNQAKQRVCYYCGKICDGFCNSHTVPAFCLKNIADKGKVYYANTIIDLPVFKIDKGVNEAGTFHLICRECDGKIFQDYEEPLNYENIPTIKMLAQIDMKNNLKFISKRLMEKEMYDLMQDRMKINIDYILQKQNVSNLDLKEYQKSFRFAKKCALKPFPGEYYIGFYAKLEYRVPIAFQGFIAMIADMEENIINNIYSNDPKYIVKNISLCIFPFEKYSVIMLFVDKNNRRYSKFFRQLQGSESIEEKLEVINYILFSYCEDYFISPLIEKETLEKLKKLMGKTSTMLGYIPTTANECLEAIKKIYDFSERNEVPNLLSSKYALEALYTKNE